jgi:hypothetical protein
MFELATQRHKNVDSHRYVVCVSTFSVIRNCAITVLVGWRGLAGSMIVEQEVNMGGENNRGRQQH